MQCLADGFERWHASIILPQEFVEILNGLGETCAQLRFGFPTQLLPRKRNVGLALAGIILRERLVHQLRLRAGQLEHLLGEFLDRKLVWIAEINWTGEFGARVHHPQEAVDEIIDVAERASLLTVPVDGDRLTLQGLDDEVRDNPTIIGVHARPIGIEDPHDLNVEIMLAVIVEEQGLRAALAFIIARARSDGVNVPPVALWLRMDRWVAIDFGGRGLHDPRLYPFGEAQHVDRPDNADLGRLNRVELVVDRARRTGEIIDLVDLDIEWKANVVPHELEARMASEVIKIALVPSKQVIDAKDFIAAL